MGIQSETPEEFHQSQCGGAYVVNRLDLFWKQISLDLAVFVGDEGREKNNMFQ